MSVQIFLEGKLLGIDEFLLSPAGDNADQVFLGRSHWISLLSEALPRALLAELGLAKILLGSSGGGQFLLVLPDEFRDAAQKFLEAAAAEIGSLSGGVLKLLWSITENLGDWSDVRRRLQQEMDRRRGAPADQRGLASFDVPPAPAADADAYFIELAAHLREAGAVAWSPENPGRVSMGPGKHSWSLAGSSEALPLARAAALGDDGAEPAATSVLAARAGGLETWGVLRGDVDTFGIRMRRTQTIEEHIQLSVLYKQFFAGELEVLCSMPEFWRKVTVIYAGGDDFAVYGAWDALLAMASEMERLFHRFAEQNLKDYPGAEGKTISMSLALAPAEIRGQGLHLAAGAHAGMEAVRRGIGAKRHADAHGVGFRMLTAIFARLVRNLSRIAIASVAPPSAADRRRAAVALSSAHPADSGRGPAA
jgi:CRISPR-associated protein Csm1